MASNTSNSTPTYYSPTAILTDSQKAPTTFTLAVPTLTPLNNGSAVEEGTKLDLPLWLAEMLAVSKPAGPASPTSLASLDMPFALGPRVLNALKADPKSVDVRAQAPWFYGLGERMLELFEDEEVGEVLLEVCLFFPCFIQFCRSFFFLIFNPAIFFLEFGYLGSFSVSRNPKCQLCSSAAFCIGMCFSSTYSQFGCGPHQATPADYKPILYRLSNNEPWKSQTSRKTPARPCHRQATVPIL